MGLNEDVKITITGNTDEARRLFAAINKGMSDTGRNAGQAGQRASGTLGRITKDIRTATLAIAGVGSVISGIATFAGMVRRELEQFRAQGRRAAGAQLDFADTQRNFLQALGDAPSLTGAQATARIKAKAAAKGVDPNVLGMAATTAFSSRGNVPANKALETVLGAAELAPHLGQQEMEALVQGALVTQKQFGASPRASLAGTLNLYRKARQSTLGDVGRYTMPAIGRVAAFGGKPDDFQDIAAFVAGIGQRAEDPEGRVTATGAVNFMRQLQTTAQKEGFKGKGFVDTKKWLFGTEGGQKARNALLGPMAAESATKMGLSTRAPLFIAFTEWLQGGDTPTRQMITEARRGLPGLDAAGVQAAQQAEQKIRNMPEQGPANTKRILKGVRQGNQLLSKRAATRDAIRSELEEILTDMGSAFNKDMTLNMFDLQSRNATSARDLQRIASRVLRANKPQPRPIREWTGGPVDPVVGWHPLSAVQQEQAAMLESGAAALDKQRIQSAASTMQQALPESAGGVLRVLVENSDGTTAVGTAELQQAND